MLTWVALHHQASSRVDREKSWIHSNCFCWKLGKVKIKDRNWAMLISWMDGVYGNSFVFQFGIQKATLLILRSSFSVGPRQDLMWVQASSEENDIQKLRRGLCTENASFPQLVDIPFADWVVVFAAEYNSSHAKFLEQVVKCPMKMAKGILARRKLR